MASESEAVRRLAKISQLVREYRQAQEAEARSHAAADAVINDWRERGGRAYPLKEIDQHRAEAAEAHRLADRILHHLLAAGEAEQGEKNDGE